MVDTKNEIWKPTHLNKNYLVSNLGRVKSIERLVPTNRFFGKDIVQTTKD